VIRNGTAADVDASSAELEERRSTPDLHMPDLYTIRELPLSDALSVETLQAAMNEVTRVLSAIQQRDPSGAGELLPLVYEELRKLATARLAREKPGQTLQATALVHEAYLRLVGKPLNQHWDHRGHFFAAAAEAMRRILIEKARRKQSRQHSGGVQHQHPDLEVVPDADNLDPLEVLAVHESLDRLAVKSPRKAELVKLRYFLGCTMAETAEILGIAQATAEEDWTYAKAWLRRQYLQSERKKS